MPFAQNDGEAEAMLCAHCTVLGRMGSLNMDLDEQKVAKQLS